MQRGSCGPWLPWLPWSVSGGPGSWPRAVQAQLRLRGLVQPVDGRLRPQRRRLRAVWRRGRHVPLQPAHRHLRADAAGLERLRQLGHDLGAARRPVGDDLAVHEPRHRQHDPRDPGQRRRRVGLAARARRRRHRRPHRQRRRVRRPRRQRLPQAGRRLAEVRRRRLEQRAAARERAGPRPGGPAGSRPRGRRRHVRPAQPRLQRALAGPAAHARLLELPGRPWQRQLLPRRRLLGRRARRGHARRRSAAGGGRAGRPREEGP